MNGQNIVISATSNNHINPMDINSEYGEGSNPVTLKSEFILSLCEILMKDKKLGPLEESIIDRCTNKVYRSFQQGNYQGVPPTLIDLREELLKQPEKEASGRIGKGGFYVLSMDVGRKGCDSVVCVFKVTPQPQGVSLKQLVNIFTLSDEHFEDQCIKVKKLFYKFKAKRLVIDGNGLGIGLLDYLVKPQIDPDTNELFPDFGVYNDEDGYYKKYRTQNCEQDALYIIKANAPINTEAHANAQTQLSSGKVKMLIDERVAKTKLLGTKVGQNMTPEERAEYLKPFTLTSILKEEMLNLREENEGVNIILKQANRGIKKDKFSAFEYGLYYIKHEEDNKKKKKKFNAKEWCFFN